MAALVQKHEIYNFNLLLLIIIIISSNFIIPSHQSDCGFPLPKITELHFFFHDTVGGRNPTAVNIIQPKSQYSATLFGSMFMIDDPLTVGPNMRSGIMGRAQGFYVGASMETLALMMVMNYVFTDKSEFNGSTLSVMGRNPVLETVREMSIVSGTGVFRLAKGFALAKTYSINNVVAVVEYNVTVYHFG